MSDLYAKSLRELRALMDAGDCSSRDIVQSLHERIEAVDGAVGAYLERDLQNALKQAAAADERRAAGEKGAMLGIPVAIKDLLNVKGQSCRCGSKLLEGYVSPYDATCIAKLRAAGAVMYGRVNMDEFAMGASTENSALGLTRNPWDLQRVPGGSSGGSAAAVAADAAIVSLGSDTGGSVRQPASFCGCVGLKPGYGRVSRYGLTAFASSLDQVGVLSKTVADAADTFGCIGGYDPRDSTSVRQALPDVSGAFSGELKGMKVGVAEEFFGVGVDPEVEAAVRKAIEHVAGLGAEIVPVSFPHLQYAVAAYYIIAPAEASTNLARFDGVRYGARVDADDPVEMMKRTREAGFGPEVKRRILLGTYVLSSGYYDAYYVKALKARALIKRDFDQVFSACDVLLGPVSPTPAYRIGEEINDPLTMYKGDICTIPANLAGGSGMSVPCGFSSEGLPIGLQILAPAFSEDRLFRVGHAYEQSTDWHLRKPQLSASRRKTGDN
ncbi:MAG: Asp-tRNA(Asn)/Glu-tRNA(Gln) amidotransferase subunit GatA [Verrucomicrobia bacterium]|nr:Asp-tRNA(Asn)/Glu-tRNA(Gln) amidotransferase subunit GatA [Verrucomicrobiota bacterium]MCH8510310.1 Asp-tRNA(Asn)/Glu-tRNA(Gln) amidotransferase subunit GatA [Kiritimatiellia bacterium]